MAKTIELVTLPLLLPTVVYIFYLFSTMLFKKLIRKVFVVSIQYAGTEHPPNETPYTILRRTFRFSTIRIEKSTSPEDVLVSGL